jgi:anti-sigma B factor antagonist
MEVAATHHDHITVLTIAGSVDSLTADHLTARLSEQISASRIHLVADFAAVDYTSSAGLRSLLGAVKDSRRLGGDLRLAAVQPSVLRVLSLSGFASIIKIFGDVGEAVSSYQPKV